MNRKPNILSILQNDSWTALTNGAFFAALAATTIILVVNPYLQESKSGYEPFFIVISVGLFIAASSVSILRIRYVRNFFANSIFVKAEIIEVSAYKSSLRLNVRYTHQDQVYEKKLTQVITNKTKKLLQQSEVNLAIDPQNPEQVLIGDVYF